MVDTIADHRRATGCKGFVIKNDETFIYFRKKLDETFMFFFDMVFLLISLTQLNSSSFEEFYPSVLRNTQISQFYHQPTTPYPRE
jgi:hypothetical protein